LWLSLLVHEILALGRDYLPHGSTFAIIYVTLPAHTRLLLLLETGGRAAVWGSECTKETVVKTP